MAAQPISIPNAPGTPEIHPPTPTENSTGLGIEGLPSPRNSSFDSNALSPLDNRSFFPGYSSSPTSSTPPNGSAMAARRGSGNPGPFNFQPMIASKSPPVTKPNQRRGHRYKHSSISHQIFLEPPVRAPLALPASLPIPTRKELIRSVSTEQRTRLLWCLCHLCVAGFTLYSAQGSLALTALSHLIMFDALGASLCVAVDVLSNFEVWKRSSVRHPFGLERAEVLAGFAMSVFLLFVGFDIITHTAEHLVEGFYEGSGGHDGAVEHEVHAHEAHMHHARVSPGSVDLASLAALVSTCISAILLRNHARIGKAMRFAALESLPSILSNPSHFLTIFCSFILLLIPLISIHMSAWLDRALALSMALCMIAIGVRLVCALGSMLLMSYGGKGIQDVVREIEEDTAITGIQEARFWQVHHGLCMANLKVNVSGSVIGESGELKVRERITRLIRDRLGGGYGKGAQRWEVSVALRSTG
ncbi:hypothetical protein L873DRAFT_1844352 [Choiromyces venosus 120613-1]|uniref:Zinc transporter n=1 Tax=Choiromyces venosus 120613-1 TaxID=1336337 RepID=A0A3N4JNW0_9PEZI|nr:hypothetical protein L873DRAFT_1844352 [Choiromyces venosus 120613-1]